MIVWYNPATDETLRRVDDHDGAAIEPDLDHWRHNSMMSRRRLFAGVMATLLAAPTLAKAQMPGKVYRIGLLQNTLPATADAARLQDAFSQALREHGFVEGRNVIFERRFAEGRFERIPTLAAELVQAHCDIIVVTTGDAGVRALKELTSTIPIVMSGASDPVRDGFAASLAHVRQLAGRVRKQ